jgi:hypothetical protein
MPRRSRGPVAYPHSAYRARVEWLEDRCLLHGGLAPSLVPAAVALLAPSPSSGSITGAAITPGPVALGSLPGTAGGVCSGDSSSGGAAGTAVTSTASVAPNGGLPATPSIAPVVGAVAYSGTVL